MKMAANFSGIVKLVILLSLLTGIIAQATPQLRERNKQGDTNISLAPQPGTVDQIVHNQGNIITTVDNYGYIGGYAGYGLPSGEWPRNSGHDYIGELRYWMGAVVAATDTLVANTYDDFQAISMPINGVDEYKIYLSTDTTRYWGYDPNDTVGSGSNNPANGWRIWSEIQNDFVYNQSYNPLASSYNDGGPTSLQESHYRFNDAASGAPLMGLELTQTILQWNYCYNEDFMFVKLEIKNTSNIDYVDFAFGLYMDIDVGGPDGSGENGRLGDLAAFDISENLAWMYDLDGFDAGWGLGTGLMGTKLLKTPQDLGMTAIRVGEWEQLGRANDQLKYELINSTSYDTETIPRDLLYIQCTRGINLTAGSTVEVVYALIAGEDEADFRANADMAQQTFDSDYVGPEPPPTPTLSATASNEKVYLYWDNAAELGQDPLSGVNDFSGYKLYRSDNQGKTWGTPNYNTGNNCILVDYSTIVTHSVEDPADPVPHSFIDTGLYNGVEYWYCLASFDRGDTNAGVDWLQSGFGLAGENINIVAVTPRNDPAGFFEAAANVEHLYSGAEQPANGIVTPVLFDPSATVGAEYEISFEDSPTSTIWHMINKSSGDTVLLNQSQFGGDPNMLELGEGLRILITEADLLPTGYSQTTVGGASATLAITSFDGASLPYWTGVADNAFGHAQYRASYELRYSTDSTVAYSLWEGFDGAPYATVSVPFEVWNLTTNQRVGLSTDEWPIDGVWTPDDELIIIDFPYDALTSHVNAGAWPYYFGWRFQFDPDLYAPSAGDIFTLEGAPVFGPDDKYTFKIDGVNSANAKIELEDIRVVPNPYFAHYSSMVETDRGESVLEFQKLPDQCTIRIYTLAGDLVETLSHTDGSGTERWNLLSTDRILVASGVYIFHVDSPYGEHIGRFSVIK